jgi:hypothetical protein
MFAARKLLLAGTGAIAVLAIAAAPASATTVLTQGGLPYTGAITGALTGGNAVATTSIVTLNCDKSDFTGQIADAGTAATAATGEVTAWDLESMASEGCATNGLINNGNAPVDLPWDVEIAWISDNTSGEPNATSTWSAFRVTATVGGFDCTYAGNHAATAGTTNQIQGDLRNPDNTESGNTELTFTNEPLARLGSGEPCPSTATYTAKYALTGTGAAKLVIREAAPPVVIPPVSGGGQQGQTGSKKRCKKKKKPNASAVAAKKCKKKK